MLSVDIRKELPDFILTAKFEAQEERLALLGASGSGKSMLLKCIAGLEKPDVGQISLDGRILFDSEKKICLPARKRRMGYLFQDYALFPNMTTAENIASAIRQPKAERDRRVQRYLKLFLLEDAAREYPARLSGGQRQRAALARMLASEPQLLLLDEPFSGLDSFLRWKLELELGNLLEQFDGTVLYATHSRDEVCRLCGRAAVLANGVLSGCTEKWDLFKAPGTLAAALLMGCKNISRARRLDERLLLAQDWGVPLETERPVPENLTHVGVHAHFLHLARGSAAVNPLPFHLAQVIEEPFSMILLFAGEGADTLLRCEYPKDGFDDGLLEDPALSLSVSPRDLMLLTDQSV